MNCNQSLCSVVPTTKGPSPGILKYFAVGCCGFFSSALGHLKRICKLHNSGLKIWTPCVLGDTSAIKTPLIYWFSRILFVGKKSLCLQTVSQSWWPGKKKKRSKRHSWRKKSKVKLFPCNQLVLQNYLCFTEESFSCKHPLPTQWLTTTILSAEKLLGLISCSH